MSEQSVAGKVAENTILTAVARVSMALALPVLGLIATLGTYWISSQFATQDIKLQAQQERVENSSALTRDRINTVENSLAGRLAATERGLAEALSQLNASNLKLAQIETKQTQEALSSERFERDVVGRLDRFQEALTEMATAVTTLTTTIRIQSADQERDRQRVPVQ